MAYKPPKQTVDNNDLKNIPSSEAIYEAFKEKIDQPAVSGTAGQLLQLDGYVNDPDGDPEPVTSWVNPPAGFALPSQTGNEEKVLATDGTSEYWAIEGVKTGYPANTVILGRNKPASLTGIQNTIIGDGAANVITTSTNNVIIGRNAANTLTNQGTGLIVIGDGAINRGSSSVVIGYNAGVNGDASNVVWLGANTGNIGAATNCIAIGREARAGSNEFAIGSSTAQINLMLLGRGGTSQTVANAVKIQTMRASGTDTDMSVGTLTIAGAQGTGTGPGGDVIIATAAPALSSGSTLNNHVEVMRVTDNGLVGIGTSSPGAKLDVRGSAVFNEDGADADFRVEGQTDAHLLFTDASADRVGIGLNNPAEKLEVAGAVLATEYRVPNYRLDPHTHDEGTETTDFTINWSNAAVHTVTLNAAGPLVITMNNPVDGGAYALRIIQGATPGTVTWPANVKWPGGTPPTLSTNTGDVDLVNLLYFDDGGGNTYYYATSALAFA